jgi:hypothetical protein
MSLPSLLLLDKMPNSLTTTWPTTGRCELLLLLLLGFCNSALLLSGSFSAAPL